MLRNLLFFALLFSVTCISAQTVPQAFRYQAVLRDLDDNVITNQQVSIRLDLLQNTSTVVYQEVHTVTTNSIGLMILNIGQGTPVSGTFSSIDWGQPTGLGIALDPTGGDQFEELGFVDLLSVPYALYAGNAGSSGDDADADPANEIQMLTQSGDTISLSQGGGTIVIDSDDADADPANEIQMLTQSGDTISLSQGGGSIVISNPDADPMNELQDWTTLPGIPADLLDGDQVADADADPRNEIEMPSDAEAGDIAYYDGSSWKTVTKGGTGQVLTLGRDGIPFWDGLIATTLPNGEEIFFSPENNFEGQGRSGMVWGPNDVDIVDLPNITSGSQARADYNGKENTAAIVAQLGDYNPPVTDAMTYAAKYCDDLEAFGHDDWYLPAAGEILLAAQQTELGIESIKAYWTSTEISARACWFFFQGAGFAPDVFDTRNQGKLNVGPEGNILEYVVRCARKDD